ncbi:uncharacterized protein [Procambarus clarkii]|uniref:uncharacterized protein n=1 Tax=Procambarus clarkii TaxID=6728 RepID=UPI0037427548
MAEAVCLGDGRSCTGPGECDSGDGRQDDTRPYQAVVNRYKRRNIQRQRDEDSEEEITKRPKNEDMLSRTREMQTNGRKRLLFPTACQLNFHQKLEWTVRFAKEFFEYEPLFKEGLHRPYITVGTEEAVEHLTKDGFENIVMVTPEKDEPKERSETVTDSEAETEDEDTAEAELGAEAELKVEAELKAEAVLKAEAEIEAEAKQEALSQISDSPNHSNQPLRGNAEHDSTNQAIQLSRESTDNEKAIINLMHQLLDLTRSIS